MSETTTSTRPGPEGPLRVLHAANTLAAHADGDRLDELTVTWLRTRAGQAATLPPPTQETHLADALRLADLILADPPIPGPDRQMAQSLVLMRPGDPDGITGGLDLDDELEDGPAGAEDHLCDAGDFSRVLCADPCESMHSYCTRCGQRQDPCAHDTDLLAS